MKPVTHFAAALLALCALPAIAQPPAAAPHWQRPQAQPQRDLAAEAEAVVKEGMEAMLAFMNRKPRPTDMKLAAFLQEQVVPRFDFKRMAQMSLGPTFQRLNAEKATELEQHIEQHFLKALVNKLSAFDEQRIRFFRPRRSGFNSAVVTVGVANPGGYPARFDFRMYLGKDGWKIYDVAANGHSVVTYYRRHFARQAWAAQARPVGR